MRTLLIKTLEDSLGAHPKAGTTNIRLLSRGDRSGVMDIQIGQYPNATTPLTISGGVFVVGGADQTSLSLTSSGGTVRVRLTSDEAYLSAAFTGTYFFREANPLTVQNANSPIIDYAFDAGNRLYTIANMFSGYSTFNRSVRGLNLSGTALEAQRQLENLFAGASVFNQPVNHIDVSTVRVFAGVFNGAFVFNQSLDKWDTENATLMNGMFLGARSFNQPIGHFKVSKVTVMNGMLGNTVNFDQDISAWDFNLNVTFQDFLSGSGMSPKNYDKLLIALAAKNWAGRTAGKIFQAAGVKYSSAAVTARAALVSGGWTVIDGGLA